MLSELAYRFSFRKFLCINHVPLASPVPKPFPLLMGVKLPPQVGYDWPRWRLLVSSWKTGGEVGVERCQVDKVSGP